MTEKASEQGNHLPAAIGDLSASEQVVHYVRSAIRDGRLVPGKRVRERELIEACGVSRSAIREALRTLAAEGTITIEHRHSAVVRQFSREELWSYHQVREVLEGLGASLAASNPDLSSRGRMVTLEHEMAACIESGRFSDYLSLNYEFHALLMQMGGNPLIQEHLDRASTVQLRLQAARFADDQAIRKSHAEHREIVAAILDGDSVAAEQAMRRHLRSTRRTFLEMPDQLFRPKG